MIFIIEVIKFNEINNKLSQLNIKILYSTVSKMNRSSTSPFRNNGTSRPTTGGNSESLELLIRSLERENNSLVEELTMLKNKTKKVADL